MSVACWLVGLTDGISCRFTRSAEAKERADKAPSTTSSERGHKHSSGIDSEDSSGAAPGPKAS